MTPFTRASYVIPDYMRRQYPEAVAAIADDEVWLNDRYQVAIRRGVDSGLGVPLTHLSIKRIDREPVHDWRDLQAIKNELTDPECEGMELYPAESRLVDQANQYHLWVLPKGVRVPFGFPRRLVGTPEQAAALGARQRGFNECRWTRGAGGWWTGECGIHHAGIPESGRCACGKLITEKQ